MSSDAYDHGAFLESLRRERVFMPKLRRRLYNRKFDRLQARSGARASDPLDLLRSGARSDTIFVFGSGHSLAELGSEDWQRIEAHDTIAFNWFFLKQAVRIDYHVVRESCEWVRTETDLVAACRQYAVMMDHNPNYAETRLFIQSGSGASTGNCLVGMGFLPGNRTHARFGTKSRAVFEPPSMRIEDGLVHGPGTLIDTLNLALLGDWRTIVIAGVDLYDQRYHWDAAPSLGTASRPQREMHKTAQNGVVDFVAGWRDWAQGAGKEIYVLNPQSLLSRELPVYSLSEKSDA